LEGAVNGSSAMAKRGWGSVNYWGAFPVNFTL
jgi:hypothetical protein